MKHLYLFYFLLTFSVGTVSLGIAATLYVKTRTAFLRHYLYFYAPFSFLVMLNVVLFYIRFNIPSISHALFDVLDYLESAVAKYLVMFTTPVFIHYVFHVPRATLKNRIIGGLAIALFIGRHVFDIAVHDEFIGSIGKAISDTSMVGVMIYSFATGWRYRTNFQEAASPKQIRLFLIIFGCYLPLLFNDMFLSGFSYIRFYPILYCLLSVLFSYDFLHKPQPPAIETAPQPQMSSTLPDDAFFARYNISAREKEIVALLAQGYSNQQIGDTLFISRNTVKTHIRNIYQKLEVNSREELKTRLNNSGECRQSSAQP
ncbi:transcriptional regulator, LuxR family [Candidatus Moduliflexus flocculans]|uniref:Transcriptional regulator, LuxR family n=1 Tax=Candidatus Moduliflexus flocculans TaxID=1499966 RepID=A0A081BL92_9BACT|nr:transcriptional regulator, LuxR family [Candidatus Moduliflexus flocculans]